MIRLFRYFILLALCLTSISHVWAIAGVDAPPPPAAPRPAKFAQPEEARLKNGLQILVAERHQLPLIAANVVIRHGAEVDPRKLAGAASMTGDLLTKGTESMSAPEIANAIESLGGSIDSGAGWDSSVAGVVVMSDKTEQALQILADVVRHPAFQDAEIARLKKQRLDGLRVALQQPGSLARYVAERLVFGTGEYGHAAGGTLESVQAIQRSDVTRLYHTYYQPKDAALVIAGDITLAQAKQLAQKLFGDWQNESPAPNEQRTGVTRDKWQSENVVVDMPDAGQAAVMLVKPTIPRHAPDYYAGLVTNAALGNGFVSRLNREIRIKRGLSYGAGSSLDTRRDAGEFGASAQTKNESASEVVSLMQTQLSNLASDPVKGNELRSRQAVLTGQFARNLETNHGFVAALGALVTYQLPLDTLDKFIPSINAVTTDEVTAFAKTHLSPPASTVIVGKSAAFLDGLRKAIPKVRVIEQANLDLNSPDLVKTKPASSQ